MALRSPRIKLDRSRFSVPHQQPTTMRPGFTSRAAGASFSLHFRRLSPRDDESESFPQRGEDGFKQAAKPKESERCSQRSGLSIYTRSPPKAPIYL
jgi:hypothetical protein